MVNALGSLLEKDITPFTSDSLSSSELCEVMQSLGERVDEDPKIGNAFFKLFETLAEGAIIYTLQPKIPISALPLFDLVIKDFYFFFNECEELDPQFFQKVLANPHAEMGHLLGDFIKKLNAFRRNGDSVSILNLLNKIAPFIEKIKLQEGAHGSNIPQLFELYRMAFALEKPEYFEKSAGFFLQPDHRLTPMERFQVALQSMQCLLDAFNLSDQLLRATSEVWVNDKGLSDHPPSLQSWLDFNTEILMKSPELSRATKVAVGRAIERVLKDIVDVHNLFAHCSVNFFSNDISNHYSPVIKSNQAKDLMINGEEESSSDRKEKCFTFLRNHRFILENFVPYAREMYVLMIKSATQNRECGSKLNDISIYLRFGDLGNLERRLKEERLAPCRVERILFEEISRFSENLKKDPTLYREALKFVLSHKIVTEMRSYCIKYESLYDEFLQLLQGAIEGPLKSAEAYQHDLFIFAASSDLYAQRSFAKRASVDEVGEEETEESTVDSDFKIEKEGTLGEAEQSPLPQFTTNEYLQQSQEKIKLSFQNLMVNCRGLGTEEALIDARSHFENIHCTLGRFFHLAQKPISSNELISFVIDSVRYGTLASEQMLTALLRESNLIQTQEMLEDFLSHDLYYLLLNCQCKGAPLSGQLRKWIQEISKGEILVRNLNQCSFGKSSLESLLHKVSLLIQGNSPFTPQEIFVDVISYLKKAADLWNSLEVQIHASKEVQNSSQPLQEQSFKPFSLLCRGILDQFNPLQIAQDRLEDSYPQVAFIRQHIQDFQEKFDDSTPIFENVLQNFLAHLNFELCRQPYLQPFEGHLHLCNVLLIDQMVAEETLLNLLSLCKNKLHLDHSNHALLDLVLELGIKKKDFNPLELAFLKRGKATRRLVRYSASYDVKYPKGKKGPIPKQMVNLVNVAKIMSAKQQIGELPSLEVGFQWGNRKDAAKFDQIKALARSDVEVLESILAKVFKKLLIPS